MSTTTESEDAQAARTRELERRLALVEDLLYEIIDLLPRDRLQPRFRVLYRLLCELDGVPEDFDGDMSDLEEHGPALRLVREVAP